MINPLVSVSIVMLVRVIPVLAFSQSMRPGQTIYQQAKLNNNNRYDISSSHLFNWFNKNEEAEEIDVTKLTSRKGKAGEEEELMHRTVSMMENHRRSQEAAERTATIMDDLSNSVVTGKSKAGSGAMGLGGSGVKVTFDGTTRPISVEVDPKFLMESGVISVEILNNAITEAMVDGYEQSAKLMGEKMQSLYEHLGLPKEGDKK